MMTLIAFQIVYSVPHSFHTPIILRTITPSSKFYLLLFLSFNGIQDLVRFVNSVTAVVIVAKRGKPSQKKPFFWASDPSQNNVFFCTKILKIFHPIDTDKDDVALSCEDET